MFRRFSQKVTMIPGMGQVSEYHFFNSRPAGKLSRLSCSKMPINPAKITVVQAGFAKQQIRPGGELDQSVIPAGVRRVDNRFSTTLYAYRVAAYGMVCLLNGDGIGADLCYSGG